MLVHGAWADGSSWTPVAKRLQDAGYRVVVPANPLRSLTSDSAYIANVVKRIDGPVVLVGHSYGGAVITDAATGAPNVKALVYVAAIAPAQGDSLASLAASKQASEIPALPLQQTAYATEAGTQSAEFTIDPAKYRNVFLDGRLPKATSQTLAVEQRPLGVDALTQPSSTPAWESIPSWYLVAPYDRAIAPDLERYMARPAPRHAHQRASGDQADRVCGTLNRVLTTPRPLGHVRSGRISYARSGSPLHMDGAWTHEAVEVRRASTISP